MGQPVSTATHSLEGQPFGRYRLLDCLGEGGMAIVYRAVTEGPQGFMRELVVKRIRADLSRDAGFISMLMAEARLCALLKHPGVVQVHELGEVDGEYFIAMELVEGHDLSSVILRAQKLERPPPVGVVCHLVLQVAEALAYAHTLHDLDGQALEIVHRDVSPSNVMVTPRGAVKLLDFGVARAIRGASDERTRTGTLKGKIGYLSPEQADGLPIDHRTDIFALGIVFHELLTLKRLFRGDDELQTLRFIRESRVMPPERSDLGPEVQQILMAMLSRDVALRPKSCQEIVERLQPLVHELKADAGALKRWLDELAPIPPREVSESPTRNLSATTSPSPTGKARPRRPPPRRWSRLLVGLGLVAVIGVGAATQGLLPKPASSRSRSIAVLGFRNLAARPEAAWLDQALSEMIATELDSKRLRLIPAEQVARARVEVGATDFDRAAPETMQKLRSALGADLVLDGSYLALGDTQSQVRLDLRLSDRSGATLATLSESGAENQLLALVARAGTGLRTRLGEGAIERSGAAPLPSDPEAARLYAEGLAQLRLLDAQSARERLTRAAALEPQHPFIHAALAAAEEALGYSSTALVEAKRAFELSQTLAPADRLAIEGRYRLATKDWERAITAYRSCFALHPDSVDDGLELASAQIDAQKGDDALKTLGEVRKLPAAADDPRVELAEARAALILATPKRALDAAQVAIKKSAARGAPILLAQSHQLAGRAHWALANAKEALAAYTTAEKMYAAAHDDAGRASALVLRSSLHSTQGDLAAARRCLEEVQAIALKLRNKKTEASALIGLANLVSDGSTAADNEALASYQRALALCLSIDDRPCVATIANNIGSIYQARRDLQAAKKSYEQAAELLRGSGVGEITVVVFANLASVLFDLGDPAAARAAAEEALAACRRNGTKADTSWALYYLARTEAAQGELDAARSHFEEAARVDEQQGKKAELAAAKAALAELLLDQNKHAEAEALGREALALAKAANSTDNLGFGSEAHVAEVLVRILLAQGEARRAEAQQLFARTKEATPAGFDPDWAMLQAVTGARLAAAQGKRRPALAALQKELAKTNDYLFHSLWIRLAMVELAEDSEGGKALAVEARKRGFESIARRASRR